MRGNGGGQMDGEGGAGAGRAVDGQPAAVAVEDVLDERQTESGSALRAAFGDVDAIEALGQPRQMFGRDARPVIAHADLRFRLAVGRRAGPELDIDALAGGAIFERVLDQVLEDADQFVVVAQHRQGVRRRRC